MKGFIWFITLIELLLITLGPSLIATDISLLSEWLHAFGGDFYTIMTLAALISIWSIFGLTAILYKSKHGLKVYLYGLSVMILLQFILSFIHSILLFQYRPLLFDICLGKQQIDVFWWPLGGSENYPMMKGVNDTCALEWHRFAKQRIITLCIYNVVLLFCLYIVAIFYQHQCQARHRVIEEEKQMSTFMKIPDHPLDEKFVAEMYRQRQKIFDEIAKRREALKSSTQRRSSLNNPPPPHFSPPFHRRTLDTDGEIVMSGMPTKPPPIYYDDDSKAPLLQEEDAHPSIYQTDVSQGSQESFTTADSLKSKEEEEEEEEEEEAVQ